MIPLRMSIMLSLPVLAMCTPDSFSRIFFNGSISTVGQFLSQPNLNHVYTEVRSQASHMGQIDQKYAHKSFKVFARQSASSPLK